MNKNNDFLTDLLAKVIKDFIKDGLEYVVNEFNNGKNQDGENENTPLNKKFDLRKTVYNNLANNIDDKQLEEEIKKRIKILKPKDIYENLKQKQEYNEVLKACNNKLKYEAYKMYQKQKNDICEAKCK